MMRAAIAVLIVCAACGEGRSASSNPNHAVPQELVAAWDASMQVNQSYPLQPGPSAATEICGTISLVENHAAASAADVDPVTYLGVYDLPLSRIGLEWSGAPSFPEATVSIGRSGTDGSSAAASDSVRIVLNPGNDERIVLSGRYEANAIRGAWVAQSARGTASGSFSMRPHTNSRSESRDCWS